MSELTKGDIKTLRSIRNMVKKTHWAQGAYHDKDGEKDLYCLVGLVNHKTGAPLGRTSSNKFGESPARRRLLNAVRDAIQTHRNRKTKPWIEQFNDGKKTTREDIIAVLDIAIGDKK